MLLVRWKVYNDWYLIVLGWNRCFIITNLCVSRWWFIISLSYRFI